MKATTSEVISLVAGELDAQTLADRHGVSVEVVTGWRSAFLAGLRLLGAQLCVVRDFQRLVERLLVLSRIVGEASRRLVWELIGLDEVQPPQLGQHIGHVGSIDTAELLQLLDIAAGN